MNDTLMDQCRREAEERYPMPVFESGNYVHTTDVAIAHAVVSARQESHAAALYAERSKRPPAVDGPSMITVEEAMGVFVELLAQDDLHFRDEEIVRERLTAADARGFKPTEQ